MDVGPNTFGAAREIFMSVNVRSALGNAGRPVCQQLESRFLLAAGDWIINGTNLGEDIFVEVDPDNEAQLVAYIDDEIVSTRLASGVKKIIIDSGAGDD